MEYHAFAPLPPSPKTLAAILAALILGDIETGAARLPPTPDTIVYGESADVIATPDETIHRGTASSADLVRLLGGSEGEAVGVVGTAGTGYHAVLLKDGKVLDPAVGRGFPAQSPEFYAEAIWIPIKRPIKYQIGRVGPTGSVAMETRSSIPMRSRAPAPSASAPAGAAPATPPVTTPSDANPGVVGPLDLVLPGMREILSAASSELAQADYNALVDAAKELTALHALAAGGASIDAAMDQLLTGIDQFSPPAPGSDAEQHRMNQLLALASLHALLHRPDVVDRVRAGSDLVRKAALACATVVLSDLASSASADSEPDDVSEEPRLFDTQDGESPRILPFGGGRGSSWLDRPRASTSPVNPGCAGSCGSV